MESVRLIPAQINILSYAEVAPDALTEVGVLTDPARIYLAQNFTDVFIECSQDGFYPEFMLPPGGFLLLDLGTNKGLPNTAALPVGYGLWVSPYESTPTMGFITLSYWYSG